MSTPDPISTKPADVPPHATALSAIERRLENLQNSVASLATNVRVHVLEKGEQLELEAVTEYHRYAPLLISGAVGLLLGLLIGVSASHL